MRRRRNCLTISSALSRNVRRQAGFLPTVLACSGEFPSHVISCRLQEALGSLSIQGIISTKEVNMFHLGLTTGWVFALWITCDLFEMLIHFLTPGPLGHFSQEVLHVLKKYKLISIYA